MKKTICFLMCVVSICVFVGCGKIKITPKGQEKEELVTPPQPPTTIEIQPPIEEINTISNLEKAKTAVEERMDNTIQNTADIMGYFVIPNETTNTIEVTIMYTNKALESLKQEDWNKLVTTQTDFFMKMQNTLYQELEVNVKLKVVNEKSNKLLVIDKGLVMLNDFVPTVKETPEQKPKETTKPEQKQATKQPEKKKVETKKPTKKYYCQSCGTEITKGQYDSWKRCSPCARTTTNEQRKEYTCKYCGKGYYIEDGLDDWYCSELCAVQQEGKMHEEEEKRNMCKMGCGDTCLGNDFDEDGICDACER